MIFMSVTYIFESYDDRESFFEELYENNIPDTFKNEKGNLMYDYFFPVENDNELLLHEKWETNESLEAHYNSKSMQALKSIKEKYVKETEVEKYCN